mgnify:FL=1
MKTLKSALALLALTAVSSAGFAHPNPFEGDTPGYARDDGKPVYEGIGEKSGPCVEDLLTTLSVESLDPADFPGEGEDEPGYGEWGPSEAGNAQPGLGAPHSGPRPPRD